MMLKCSIILMYSILHYYITFYNYMVFSGPEGNLSLDLLRHRVIHGKAIIYGNLATVF